MALSKGANTYNRVNWEDAEFPILCQVCLGNNPYLRMMKDKFGGECKICMRPFTSFRWCPGRGMRYKKTEVCQTCSKLKNVCQTCLLDLEYGLPVQVRDTALQLKEELPKSGSNKDYYLQNVDKQIAEGDKAEALSPFVANEMLAKLSRNTPYYRRNLPHICSFWVKGECKRGEECPYRHEKPTDPDDPLSDQNLKDRYYGVNDPVADKILNRVKDIPGVAPPEDKSITTVYIGGLGEDAAINETDLRNYFYQFGEIRSISVVPTRGCAFVTYTARDAAERAVNRCVSRATIKGKKLSVRWGKSSGNVGRRDYDDEGAGPMVQPVPGLPMSLPPPPDFFGLRQMPHMKRPHEDNEATEEGDESSQKRQPGEKELQGNRPPGPPSLFSPGPMMRWPGPGGMYPPPFLPRPPMFPPSLLRGPPMEGARFPAPPIYYQSQDPQRMGAKELQD